ncbi:hypothetical protein [Streptomyces sp. NPDC048665]|uniref:hypothetical protein n=1 Tax=Streptomyces sp. NPDC048665 TaxID=3155490 RepID=UPI00341F4259
MRRRPKPVASAWDGALPDRERPLTPAGEAFVPAARAGDRLGALVAALLASAGFRGQVGRGFARVVTVAPWLIYFTDAVCVHRGRHLGDMRDPG